jgi:hypothetical protein
MRTLVGGGGGGGGGGGSSDGGCWWKVIVVKAVAEVVVVIVVVVILVAVTIRCLYVRRLPCKHCANWYWILSLLVEPACYKTWDSAPNCATNQITCLPPLKCFFLLQLYDFNRKKKQRSLRHNAVHRMKRKFIWKEGG